MIRLVSKFVLLIYIFLSVSCTNPETVDTSISDNKEIYKDDNTQEIKEVYVTVLNPKSSDKKYNYTFSQMNSVSIDNLEYNDAEVKVIFQEGKDGTLKSGYYGYGQSEYNATMELRGQSARLVERKSYKINLNSKVPWDGYITVNLNKHPFDHLLIRNKLAFELIKSVPNLTSARTQLVHMFIKDFSKGDYLNDYVDYGLFTQIENIDEDYLENHNLDENGNLYKIENFEFRRYEDVLLRKDNPNYDKDAFEEILEIKGGNSHEKLINMLDDVNNDYININDVIEKHFDRENFLTWLALNILSDNVDTQSRNYFLYSPSTSNIWYFIPWDYDKALGGYEENRAIWQKGVSNFWGNIFINRFLMNKNNVKELSNKVEELHAILNKQLIKEKIDILKPIAIEYLSREPDMSINDNTIDEILLEFDELLNEIELNYDEYYKSIERPMPIFLGSPYLNGNFIEFNWTESFDFQDDPIYYDFEISKDPEFKQIIYKKENLLDNEIIIDKLEPNHYYYRVLIYDINDNKSDAFDIYYDKEKNIYCYGVKDFYVY